MGLPGGRHAGNKKLRTALLYENTFYMKKRWLVFILPLLLAACTQKAERMELSDWQFEYNGQRYPATVPGFIHTDLMANGLIPDPYYGTNEDSVQWVSGRAWVYTTRVLKKDLPKDRTQYLVFEGVAGTAELTINNELVGYIDNMFARYEVPFVHDFPGDTMNIRLTVWPLPAATGDTSAIMMDGVPMSDSLLEARYGIPIPDRRAFWRIAPYQMGWDWGPKLPTCGIWKPVYITNKSQSELKEPSENNSFCSFSSDCKIELRQEQDSIGQSFTFYRDGKPIFIKGANWIPVHSFPVLDETQKARYRHLLCSAKEAGFNMIRIWGGGIYEHDYFYDLCDSLGLMVWQDFVFAGTPYPDNEEMLESIREEARQQVARLAKHPCIVLWCGNNEVKNGWEDWGWQGQFNWTPEQRARLEKAMDTIFGYSSTTSNTSSTSILAKAVRDCDPLQRPYITTSPLYGWGHPECVTHGDSHYWGVWWGELPFEVYKEKTGRFMSEYGFQSYPMLSTIRQFCPEDQLSIDSPTLRNHQKHGRGREIIDKAMRQYYGFDSRTLNLEDYAYVSQLLQAWGVGYGILCHLSDPRCAGTLYWQLNDCWPVASWSSIDYYGNWKALHYRAQALYDDNVDLKKWEQYYSVYPKDRTYAEPKYNISQAWQSDGSLVVTIKAGSDLYDVYIETVPHIDGHFSRNFVDLRAGEKLTAKLIPADPEADVSGVKIAIKTLNDIYRHNGR